MRWPAVTSCETASRRIASATTSPSASPSADSRVMITLRFQGRHLSLQTRQALLLRLLVGTALGDVAPNGHDAPHMACGAPYDGCR